MGRFNRCHYSNLNGYNYGDSRDDAKSISWNLNNGYKSLESVEMAIKGNY